MASMMCSMLTSRLLTIVQKSGLRAIDQHVQGAEPVAMRHLHLNIFLPAPKDGIVGSRPDQVGSREVINPLYSSCEFYEPGISTATLITSEP